MIKKQKAKQIRNSYKRITQPVRLQIIDRILEKGENLKDVSQEMNVNISTCKAIVKVYQDEGRVGKKKRRNKVYNVIQTYSFFIVDDNRVEQIGDIKIQQNKVSLLRNEQLDDVLGQNSKVKAKKMLDQLLEKRKKEEDSSTDMQRQMTQVYWMKNGYLQYFPANNQQVGSSQSIIKQESSIKQEQQIYKPK